MTDKVTSPASVQPDADGWIPWAGGECPLAEAGWVEIKLRDGRTAKLQSDGLAWYHDNADDDITAYRLQQSVVSDAPVTEPDTPAFDIAAWDRFAAAALQGMLAGRCDVPKGFNGKTYGEAAASDAAQHADALMLERAKRISGDKQL